MADGRHIENRFWPYLGAMLAGVSHYLENCIGCLSRAVSSSNCVF